MTPEYPPARFGAFLGPYHLRTVDANYAMHYNMEIIERLDALGFAESWVGEHHSGRVELIAAPDIFVAAAAERTKRIKLGLGVVSLPYHHPFQVADRIVQLDHMTRGRVILGAGPGQLADDSKMMGINPLENRRKIRGGLRRRLPAAARRDGDAGERLVQARGGLPPDEAVLRHRDGVHCDGVAQRPPFAGRYGASMLSLAATSPVGVELLAGHWEIATAIAAENGQTSPARTGVSSGSCTSPRPRRKRAGSASTA